MRRVECIHKNYQALNLMNYLIVTLLILNTAVIKIDENAS
jgi:hypothetical protein